MAAPDVSALLDVASAAPPAETPAAEPEVETPDGGEFTETETPETGGEPEQKPEAKIDGRTNPAAIRSALKAFRDAAPENAPLARELNDGYGRYTAYKAEFPTVAAAREARALLDAVGGSEGITGLQDTIRSVNETDQLLYAGDGKVLDSLYEDMKANGSEGAFAKLASPYLDKLRSVNEKAYFDVIKPHFYQGLVDTGLPNVLQAIAKAIAGDKPNIEAIKELVGGATEWFDNLRNSVETGDKSKLDPERQAFEQERNEFKTAKQREFQEGVAGDAERINNRELGFEFGKYLRMPFFKNFSLEQKQDLGAGIKAELMRQLSAKTASGKKNAYQTQMDAFFSMSSPDAAKIKGYHESTVKRLASQVVKTVIQRRYPNYAAKAAAAPKPAASGKTDAAAPTPGAPVKPTFVSQRPAPEQLDMTKDPNRYLLISGRGYLKRSGKFVTWNPKFK